MQNEKDSLLKMFREMDFDGSVIGLQWCGDDEIYFCTPVGAQIIGYLGVDGIHFCTIPSLQTDMIFAVSPMPCGENNVVPIARNFKDFLSLILACRDTSPLEQISWMNEAQFEELLKLDAETIIEGKDDALQTIRSCFDIEPCPNPYLYVKSIQKDYDYSLIPFSDEYYDVTGTERL